MENKRNGCKNIKKVFNHYIQYNERLEKYKRGVDLQKLQTALTEPSNCS
jgi:hypothetical protein